MFEALWTCSSCSWGRIPVSRARETECRRPTTSSYLIAARMAIRSVVWRKTSATLVSASSSTIGRSADGTPAAEHSPKGLSDPHVRLFRATAGLCSSPALPISGPLRILVAIGSPEEQNARGELLDMEREFLDAVEPARKQQRPAYVRVIERGTVKAIRESPPDRALPRAPRHLPRRPGNPRQGALSLITPALLSQPPPQPPGEEGEVCGNSQPRARRAADSSPRARALRRDGKNKFLSPAKGVCRP